MPILRPIALFAAALLGAAAPAGSLVAWRPGHLLFVAPGAEAPETWPDAGAYDLRALPSDASAWYPAAARLSSAATSARPLVVVIEPEDAPPFRAALGNAFQPGRLLVVSRSPAADGPEAAALREMAAAIVPVSAASETAGRSAFASGTAIDDVLREPVSKPRFDEARLIREGPAARDLPEPLPTQPDPATPPQPHDAVLQRALHLVAALDALGRLDAAQAPAPRP